jgi:flagellar assembly protein FliH
METVISMDETGGHIINKYNFKVLSTTMAETKQSDNEFVSGATASVSEPVQKSEENPSASLKTSPESGEVLSKSSKDELIESLLQKTDEMSSNFIKMQMKLESKEEEYKLALDEGKKEAFEEGKLAGIAEAQEVVQGEHENVIKQFSASIKTLEESTEEFSTSIAGIKEELIHAAVDIAKEIVLVEISERGNEIAATLAQSLISEIQTSAAVTIKVNPNDKVTIEQTLGTLENIKILSDNAINNGGVVILSDAGNIDGDIMKRYERVKTAALGK